MNKKSKFCLIKGIFINKKENGNMTPIQGGKLWD